MPEEPTSSAAGNGDEAVQGQPDVDLPPVVIGAQYIKDLSFENPLGPEALATIDESPSVAIEVNTNVRHLGENTYEVILLLQGEATAQEKTVFIFELTYGGLVSLNNVPEESIQPVLAIDAPRHLFPFARSIVANITSSGGFPPVMINPIDFAALFLQQHGDAVETTE